MTREEKIDWLCRLRSSISTYMPPQWVKPMEKALTLEDIQALSAEPCEDCISRQAVLNEWDKCFNYEDGYLCYQGFQDRIKSLPPVNPTSNVSIQITEREKYGRFN